MNNSSLIDQLSVALTKRLPNIKSILSIRLFASGWRHSHYLAEAQSNSGEAKYLMVRMPSVDKPSRRTTMHREHIVLKLLEDVGFPNAPRSYLYDATLKHLCIPYAVQSYHGSSLHTEADKLTSSIKGVPSKYIDDSQIEHVGRACARLHTIEFSTLYNHDFSYYCTWREGMSTEMMYLRDWIQNHFRPSSDPFYLPELQSVIITAWKTVEHLIEASRTIVDNARAHPVLLHGDLGWHNFGWVDSKLYLFDWEFTALGDPALDLAKVIRGDLLSADQRHRLLSAYEHPDLDPFSIDFVERLVLYEKIIALHTTMWALRMLSRRIRGVARTGEDGKAVNVGDFVELNIYQSLEFIDGALRLSAERVMEPHIPKDPPHTTRSGR